MNFRTIGLGLATAVTITVGIGLISSSAQAAALRGSLSIAGGSDAVVTADGINFGTNVTVDQADLDFSSLVNRLVTMKSLSFAPGFSGAVGAQQTNRTINSSSLTSFIDFGAFALDKNGDGDTADLGETGNLTFDLAETDIAKAVNIVTTTRTAANSYLHVIAPLKGFFQFGESTLATGVLTASKSGASSGFELTAEAIPSPALLPAALGMGVAALRKKRKQEANADLASEPVEA